MATATATPLLKQEDKKMIVPAIEQPDTASTLENQSVVTSRFTWNVENFSRLRKRKYYSHVFVVGGYKWRVLIFPKGNKVDHLSLYLDVADSSSLPYGWTRNVEFSMAVVNQQAMCTVKNDAKHQFNAKESDWGFTQFMPLSELYDLTRGFLVNDTCIIEVDVTVPGVDDSKKETGYVGLKDQGAKLADCLGHISEPITSLVLSPPTKSGNLGGGETITATLPSTSPEKGMTETITVGIQNLEADPVVAEFDGVDLAAEKSCILANFKESNPSFLESLHFKSPLMRRAVYDLLAQLLLDLKSLGKDSAPSAYAALLPLLVDLEVCGFQVADLKAYIELLRHTAEERLNAIAKREAAEKARGELVARLKSLDEEIAGTSLPIAPTSFPF